MIDAIALAAGFGLVVAFFFAPILIKGQK